MTHSIKMFTITNVTILGFIEAKKYKFGNYH